MANVPNKSKGLPRSIDDFIIYDDKTQRVLETLSGTLVDIKKKVEERGYTDVSIYEKVGTRSQVTEVIWK
jgi:hypothetical protein